MKVPNMTLPTPSVRFWGILPHSCPRMWKSHQAIGDILRAERRTTLDNLST
jgi:hypothetical protein